MAVEPASALHYFVPFLLCVAGFHGVLFYSRPWLRTAAWVAFQLGLVGFLFQLASSENPFPTALALLVLAVTVGTSVVFSAFCVKLGGRSKTAEGGKSPRRNAK